VVGFVEAQSLIKVQGYVHNVVSVRISDGDTSDFLINIGLYQWSRL
jgi:hypothetical protein